MNSVKQTNPQINSENGTLKTVITHFPGVEIEKMTPSSAKDALYSDILNLHIASQEYSLFRKALQTHSNVLEIKDLLKEALSSTEAKKFLIESLLYTDNINEATKNFLFSLENDKLATVVIEGITNNDILLKPAYNLFFTRDIAIVHGNTILIPKMASQVRAKESVIAKTIFLFHPSFESASKNIADAYTSEQSNLKFEGGDIHILSPNITVIGMGLRTNIEGINFIISQTSVNKKHTFIIQELPTELDSYIHLDMMFSVLSESECMIFKPVIESPNYKATILEVENGKIISTKEFDNLLDAIAYKGKTLYPVYCGNGNSPYDAREQWHSGANFFAIGNGKVVGYDRNIHTLEALNNAGYEIIPSAEIDKYDLSKENKYVVTFPGNELSRGGGGARCMTMPIVRE
jgi:arginine deiminase